MKLQPQYCSFHWNFHYKNSRLGLHNCVNNVIKFVRQVYTKITISLVDIFWNRPQKNTDLLAVGACRLDTRLTAVPGKICTGKDLYREGSVPGRICTGKDLYREGSVPGRICTGKVVVLQTCVLVHMGYKCTQGIWALYNGLSYLLIFT